ncbi:ribosomal protein L2 [Rhizodiscina lignyota]|uniref:Large ribosomal subunit protein uL2m n=1 Tax=Rhizodiscina lignyota TaxID=1504668 RepID=A0A9P4I7D4_9PEZI|nr:ribosomal protein L2 [Rhizodiscina lignyota]
MLQPRLLSRVTPSLCNCVFSSLRSYATAAAAVTESYVPPVTSTETTHAVQGGGPRRDTETQIKTYKPRTPGVRHLRRPIHEHLWKGRPWKALTQAKKGHSRGGRNNVGRITVRHRGGGHARRIRTVDHVRKEKGQQEVVRIEYDPNRSAHIALLRHETTGRMSYITAAEGMREGDNVQSYMAGIPKDLLDSMGGVIDAGMLAAKTALRGNCLPVHLIPLGTQIYNVGMTARGRAVFCRSAGTYATIVSKDEETGEKKMKHVTVRLQSGEVRKVHYLAPATIGVASNKAFAFRQLGKAGRKRWLGIRPTVRGVAMNAVDHPHGGGRGKSKGNRIPTSPWGTPAKGGYKTRDKRKSNKHVVQERHRNQGKRRVKSS